MALVIPPEFKHSLPQILTRLGGTFEQWLRFELHRSLMVLADSHDEVLMRQTQGRVRFIRELLDEIHTQQ